MKLELTEAQRLELQRAAVRPGLAATIRRRIDAVLAVANGCPVREVALAVGVDPKAVYLWIEQYQSAGVDRLTAHARGGQPRRLTEVDLAALRVMQADHGGIGLSPEARQFVAERGHDRVTVWRALKRS